MKLADHIDMLTAHIESEKEQLADLQDALEDAQNGVDLSKDDIQAALNSLENVALDERAIESGHSIDYELDSVQSAYNDAQDAIDEMNDAQEAVDKKEAEIQVLEKKLKRLKARLKEQNSKKKNKAKAK